MVKNALETDVQNEARLAVGSLPDVRCYRNNVGELKDERGIPVRYGLLEGSADLICVVAPRGRVLSLEVKRPGYKPSGKRGLQREALQQAWRDVINGMGGIALRIESAEQALLGVALARVWFEPLGNGMIFPARWSERVNDEHATLVRDWRSKGFGKQ